MKKSLALFCCILIPLSLLAQQRTGNIYGTVIDAEHNPLPGVNVTLTGATIAAISMQSNAEGKFRFLSLFPANDYVIKCELQGFKTKTATGIIVNVGKNSEITVRMEQGALQEQVTVVATTPVVDTKKTSITHTVNFDMLQELPSARDPWVILQMTPSVTVDRENIGGVESGQQSGFVAKGASSNEWTMDGMQITDLTSGGSPTYYDFDTFEELNISTGTLDVEHRDIGIVINIVTRRGGNKTSLGGRLFYTNKYLQATRPQSLLDRYGVSGYNHADDIKDFGLNAGGPFVKDKAWWWFAYGTQQIGTINQLNVSDKTYLVSYTGKINLQIIPSNRVEVFLEGNDKLKYGRDSAEYFPSGWNQSSKYPWGGPIFKIQDEQTVGDKLFLSLRVGHSNAGFGMTPANDLSLSHVGYWDITKYFENNTYTWFYSDRPHSYYVGQVQYFNDNILGTAHEIKIGFEINNNQQAEVGYWPGNIWVNENYNYPQMDYLNNGVESIPPPNMYLIGAMRNTNRYYYGAKRWAAYFNDTITKGRFNLNLGLRVDHAYDYLGNMTAQALFKPGDPVPDPRMANYAAIDASVFDPTALAAMNALLPLQTQPYIRQPTAYPYFSPRLGLTYDIFGDGKTVLKASYCLYPGGGIGVGYYQPYGLGGWINSWWYDTNNDHIAQPTELYFWDPSVASLPLLHMFDASGNFLLTTDQVNNAYGWNWGGFTWGSTALTPSTWVVDPKTWHTNLTHEVNLAVEREIMKDFGVSLSFNWRRMGGFSWSLPYYPAGSLAPDGSAIPANYVRNPGDYQVMGTVPSTLHAPGPDGVLGTSDDIVVSPGQAAGRNWYGLSPYLDANGNWTGAMTYPTAYNTYVNMPTNRYNIYYGFDLVFTKRLANKWMLNGSVTYQVQRQHLGNGWLEPTNNWANDNQPYAFYMGGGSGKITQAFYSRWMVKLAGLYKLPFDINVSGTISAHEGTIIQTYFNVYNLTLLPTGGRSYGIPIVPFGEQGRLPPVWVFNLKAEKMLHLGGVGRLYFSVDCFNIFNTATIQRRYDISLGSFYFSGPPSSAVQTDYVAPYGQSGVNNEIMNPRIFRLGIRFEF